MSVTQVATRYAQALLEQASLQGAVEETYRDVKSLEATVLSSRDLLLMMRSPIVKGKAKTASLEAIFGDQLGKLTNDFLKLLVKKRREMYLLQIIEAFYAAYNDLNNIKAVDLISASPLSEELERSIVNVIQSQIDAASLDITKTVDPSLLGGFVIKIDDKVFDTSLHNKLSALRREILAG